MNALKKITDTLAEVAGDNIELERKYNTANESTRYWHEQYEAKEAECVHLSQRLENAVKNADIWLEQFEQSQTELKEAKDKLEAAEEKIAQLEKTYF